MEKGFYSVNDLRNVFRVVYFRHGEILYFRNDDLVKRFGATYNIEIKLRVISLKGDKLQVECISYFDGQSKTYQMSNDITHYIDKKDFKSLFRFSRNY